MVSTGFAEGMNDSVHSEDDVDAESERVAVAAAVAIMPASPCESLTAVAAGAE
jgi:hypothetical protein